MKYTTLFIDFDDTLVDTTLNNREALADIFTEYDLGNYFEDFEAFYTKYLINNTKLWDWYAQGKISKEALKAEGFSNILKDSSNMTLKQSMEVNENFVKKTMTKRNVIENAIDILNYLKPKYELYILSNGFHEMQYEKIANAGMQSYFEEVFLSDQIGVNKPDPRIFEYALSNARATSKETLMIGDNLTADILGAKNSNIDQAWFNPQQQPDGLGITPTYIINNLLELKAIL